MEEGNDRKRVSLAQQEELISLMEEHLKKASIRLPGKFGRTRKQEEWQRIANRLNNMDSGVKKDAEKWYQTWKDWKSNMRKKLARIRQDKAKTGGYKTKTAPLTPLEERILRVAGIEQAAGMEEVPETDPDVAEVSDEDDVPPPLNDFTFTMDVTTPVEESSIFLKPLNELKKESFSPGDPLATSSNDPINLKRKAPILNHSAPNVRKVKLMGLTDYKLLKQEESKSRLKERELSLEDRRLRLDEERLQVDRERVQVDRERVQVERERVQVERERSATEVERARAQQSMTAEIWRTIGGLLKHVSDAAERYLDTTKDNRDGLGINKS